MDHLALEARAEISRHSRKGFIKSFCPGAHIHAAPDSHNRDPATARRRLPTLGIAVLWHLGRALGRLATRLWKSSAHSDRGRQPRRLDSLRGDPAQSGALVVLFLADLAANSRIPQFYRAVCNRAHVFYLRASQPEGSGTRRAD